ncbi:FMN-binding glutamate synthase family protein [Paenisporosarcina sp. TG20]|uniref:FMN-binding glutamate synthase family protein n=1 Tax=Paenisporosarcina sp. TG20 TaxID=1211706 RepID=UPI0002F63057|nr:FMN-binding glutamate synthase family protein [Paenisporosarcina sp. TG20]
MLEKMMLWMMGPSMDAAMKNMLTSKYQENPFLMTTIAGKLTPRAIMEAGMRAQSGQELKRPLGSPIVLSPWEEILLNPRQLFHLPTQSKSQISTKTIIGPNAKRPLKLEMPIMLTGMSYGGSLSLDMKVAIAKGTTIAGTSTNTGETGLTPEERDNAKLLIGQYNRAMRMKEEDLRHLDVIEIQLGQGAWGGAAEIETKSEKIGDHLRKTWDLNENEGSTIMPRFPNVKSSDDIVKLINRIKSSHDVPVGVKIAGSDFIELDLEVIAKTDVDFITIDGSEGGTAGSPPTLEDDIGLPTLHTLVRTCQWLEEKGLKNKYQIIVSGGLTTPGHFLKALAIGADAVYIGSIALMAVLQSQMTKALPEFPPPQLALYDGKLKDEFDVEEGATHLANFLLSCAAEMKSAVQVIGKKSTTELNQEDLVTLNKDLAEFIGIRYGASRRK